MGALDLPLGMMAVRWRGARDRRWTYDPDHYEYTNTCRGCGQPDLKWRQTQQGWRLFHKNKTQHECRTGRYAKNHYQEAAEHQELSRQDETQEDGEMQCSYDALGPNLRLVWDLLGSRTDLGDVEIAAFVQELRVRANR